MSAISARAPASRRVPSDRSRLATRRLRSVLRWALLLLALAFFLGPVLWIAMTAFKSQREVFSFPPVFIPEQIDLRHFRAILAGTGGRALQDSFAVASMATGLSLLVGVPASYALSRFRIGGDHLPLWILSIRMFPPVVAAIPLFLLYRRIGIIDTYLGLTLAYLTFNVPFVVWMMKGFFDDLPSELEDAARVDGANRWQAFTRIALPLSVPGLVSTALLCFVFAWNEFLLALFLTRTNVVTLPVALSSLVGGHLTLWGQIGALAVVAILPVVILAVVLQRFVVRGLTLGAVKG
jgi:multiple sugar transport system permease protein